jgi:glycosyltransferase involved in cell wall biosynthesis
LSEAIDVLQVSPGTTPGWRRADAELRRAFEELGLRVESCTSDYRVARHLRRTVLLTDLVEAVAMRRATTSALRRFSPRAIVYSSPQAVMLQPAERLRGATAVRFDVPAAFNRRGAGSSVLHALERRALRRVRLLLPIALELGDLQRPPGVTTPAVALPIPIARSQEPRDERERAVLFYAGNPEKKGLDVAVRAWSLVTDEGWRLRVTGLDPNAGRRFLARRGVPEPAGMDWAGVLEPNRYRQLLGRAALFLSASRYEDYGLAQLESLAAGTVLVTTASDGPYEALRLQRELDPRLVAPEPTPEALAGTLRLAMSLSDEEHVSYRRRAREHLIPYSDEAVKERLQEEVVPALLGSTN